MNGGVNRLHSASFWSPGTVDDKDVAGPVGEVDQELRYVNGLDELDPSLEASFAAF